MRSFGWDGPSSSKEHGLRGASKREQTREELLAEAKAARAARGAAKQQTKAAVTIQAAWRSHRSRSATRSEMLSHWRQEFAAAASQPDVLLRWQQLCGRAVPLVLLALLPPGTPSTPSTAAMLQGSKPLAVCNAELGPLKGTLALVIRAVGSSQRSTNYCTPAVEANEQVHAAWVHQSYSLCQLSACAAGACSTNAGASDAVLDAAAARVLALLTDASQWKAALGGEPAAGQAAQHVLHKLVQRPRPLFGAAARLLAAATVASRTQPTQPLPSSTAAPAGAGTLQRFVTLCLGLVEASLPAHQPAASTAAASAFSRTNGSQTNGSQTNNIAQSKAATAGTTSTCIDEFVLMLLAAPGFTAQLSAALKARLIQPSTLFALLLSAQQLACSKRLTGVPALWCAANLGLLLTNAFPGSCDAYSLLPSPHLSDPPAAQAFCTAMMQLLSAAKQRSVGQQQQQQQMAAALQQLWPLGSQSHLLQLLGVLAHAGQDEEGMLVFAGYCIHLVQSLSDLSAAVSVAGASNHALQPAPGAPAASAAAPHAAASAADAPSSMSMQSAEPSSSSSTSSSSSALNALAFAPTVLPTLWHWLAVHVGLPLEAALDASLGLDVAAVRGGYSALPPAQAMVLGLFCRVYSQLLLVLDDADFHNSTQPFNTSQARAIATTLNSLVFHTCFPAPVPPSTGGRSAASVPGSRGGINWAAAAVVDAQTMQVGQAMLAEYAPIALRSLYERDARRSFCRPALWVAPYNSMQQQQQQQQPQQQRSGVEAFFSAAAIVQSMILGRAAGSVEDDAAPLQARAGDGQRPASMASLLRMAPQCVPFECRVEYFRTMIEEDKARGRWSVSRAEGGVAPIKVTIRRDRLMEDAFAQLSGCSSGLKARLQVTFINAAGLQEAGLDFGGLAKELLEAVVRNGFSTDFGLFQVSDGTGLAYPRPTAVMMDHGLQLLEFLGMMVGKALYEGILLGDLALAPFFVLQLQGRRPQLDDLAALDPTLHRSLVQVKTYTGDVSDFGLYFTVDEEFFGATSTEELLPGGSSVPVTNSNRLLYVHLLANHHLNGRGHARATAAFARGLSQLVPLSALRLFSPAEFNELISGGRAGDVDVDDMMRHTKYSGGYSEGCSTIRMFWHIVRSMSPADRGALLRFITSTSRAPLGGFRYLQPPLTIHRVACSASPLALLGGADVDRLPSSSTCFSTLKLPDYRREATMRKKLFYTIHSGAGFELS